MSANYDICLKLFYFCHNCSARLFRKHTSIGQFNNIHQLVRYYPLQRKFEK